MVLAKVKETTAECPSPLACWEETCGDWGSYEYWNLTQLHLNSKLPVTLVATDEVDDPVLLYSTPESPTCQGRMRHLLQQRVFDVLTALPLNSQSLQAWIRLWIEHSWLRHQLFAFWESTGSTFCLPSCSVHVIRRVLVVWSTRWMT